MTLHWRLARLGVLDAGAHWQAAYDRLKKLDDAGKMQPVDQKLLNILAAKVAEFED